jgi:hypothetical protein
MGAVDPANPQTWNRYSYVMNNPLSFFDPLGLCGEDDRGDMDLITGTVTVIGYVPCICPPSMGYAFINGSLVCGPPANLAAIVAAAQAAAGRGPANNDSWAWTFTKSFFGGFTLDTSSGSCLGIALDSYAPVVNGFKKTRDYAKDYAAPIVASLPAMGASASNLIYSTVPVRR